MRKQFGGLLNRMALENDDLPTPGEDEPDAENLESKLLEVNESAEEGETAEAETAEAGEVAEALEAFADILKAGNGDGGLNKTGAAILSAAMEHFSNRVGIGSSAISLESFTGPSTRVGATNVAMEDLKTKAKEIWAAIVAAVKKAIEWVKAHFMKVFDAATKLQERAKKLQEQANAITGQAKDKTIENGALFKALQIGGKIPSAYSSAVKNLEVVAKGAYIQAADAASAMGNTLAELFEKQEISAGAEFMGPLAITGLNKVANPATMGFGELGKNVAVSSSPELPGGMALVTRWPAAKLSAADTVAVLPKCGAGITPYKAGAKAPEGTQLPTLAASEAGKCAAVVEELAGETIKYRAKLGELEKIKQRIIAAAEKAGNSANSEADEGKSKDLSTIQKLGVGTTRLLDQPAASVAPYLLNTGKAILGYVELSLKQYGAAAA